jgi:hypothetical protein
VISITSLTILSAGGMAVEARIRETYVSSRRPALIFCLITKGCQLRRTKHHPALGPACQPPLKDLKECSLLGRLGQTNTDLAPSKAHVT